MSIDGNEVDATQREAHLRVDDDTLVKNAVENVDETGAGRSGPVVPFTGVIRAVDS